MIHNGINNRGNGDHRRIPDHSAKPLRSSVSSVVKLSARFLKRNECCLMHEFEVVAAPGGGLRDGPAAMRELLVYIDEAIDELIADTKDAIASADAHTGAALP